MSQSPRDTFRSFLERAEDDGWIASYKWVTADTWPLLRQKLGPTPELGISRTHKRGTDGVWWALEVEAHEGTRVGVDLEILYERPILENPAWIVRRLGMARAGSPRNIIEEWSSRECAFKALAPENENIVLSQLRRASGNAFSVLTPTGERHVQVRSAWGGHWCVSLGWRTLTTAF